MIYIVKVVLSIHHPVCLPDPFRPVVRHAKHLAVFGDFKVVGEIHLKVEAKVRLVDGDIHSVQLRKHFADGLACSAVVLVFIVVSRVAEVLGETGVEIWDRPQ